MYLPWVCAQSQIVSLLVHVPPQHVMTAWKYHSLDLKTDNYAARLEEYVRGKQGASAGEPQTSEHLASKHLYHSLRMLGEGGGHPISLP